MLDGKRTFDAIVKKHKLIDPALRRLTLTVRGADMPDKALAPDPRGLEVVADGFRHLFGDDHEQLAAESIDYDALYPNCQGGAHSDAGEEGERCDADSG
jgi:hypothetical protein